MPDENDIAGRFGDISGRFGDISGRFGDISGRSVEELRELIIRDRLLDKIEFLEGRVNRLESELFMIANVFDVRVSKLEKKLNDVQEDNRPG